jgi:hypothetical protein
MAKLPLFISNDKLMILNGATSLEFEDWLQSLSFEDGPDIIGEAGYKIMFQWHKSRGLQKRCPTLNDDVMRLVVLHAVGEVRHVDNDFHHGYVLERAHGETGIPRDTPKISAVDWRLLSLNKATSKMALQVIRFDTIKNFSDINDLRQTVLDAPPNLMDCLSRLQLSFSDAKYFDFFQVTLPAYLASPSTDSHSTAAVLLSLPNLRYLDLWFHSTIPQSNFFATPHISWHSANHTVANNGTITCPYPCRHAIVDYIMCWAYPFIAHIPKVNITGYVKTKTRNAWLRILRDKRNRHSHLIEVQERVNLFNKLTAGDL